MQIMIASIETDVFMHSVITDGLRHGIFAHVIFSQCETFFSLVYFMNALFCVNK